MKEVLDRNYRWSLFALRYINHYREIDEKSGVQFYQEVGFVTLVDDNFMKRCRRKQSRFG